MHTFYAWAKGFNQPANTGQQFLNAKGFHYVIIGASIKRLHNFRFAVTHREHNNWLVEKVAQFFQHYLTIQIGQPHIQNNQIRANFSRQCQTLAPRIGLQNSIALGGEADL